MAPENLFSTFEARYKGYILFGKVPAQESKNFSFTNAANPSAYFAEVEAVIRNNHIDSKRPADLKDSGFDPDRDRWVTTNRGTTGHDLHGLNESSRTLLKITGFP